MKKVEGEPQGVWEYQTFEAQSKRGAYTPQKFCRSCGEDIPKRASPFGHQVFYCSPECAIEAATHAAAKGYASHLFINKWREHNKAEKAAKLSKKEE